MYGIIPARLNSTRLPEKALIVLKNKTLIQRVYENVIKNTILENLFVATNNKKIKDTVKSFGGNVIDTQGIHLNGTERCFEASNKINTENEDIILNIQCDEPTIDNEAINLIYDAFKHNSELKIVTLVSSNLLSNEINDPSIVKTQLDKNNFAIEFCRESKKKNNYKHIGIYGFKKKTLEKLINLKPTSNEKKQKLEQLRWIENGFKIKCVISNKNYISINTKEDVKIYNENYIL